MNKKQYLDMLCFNTDPHRVAPRFCRRVGNREATVVFIKHRSLHHAGEKVIDCVLILFKPISNAEQLLM